jgi:hypothetical protein
MKTSDETTIGGHQLWFFRTPMTTADPSALGRRKIWAGLHADHRWELLFRAWRPLLANYAKPAPAFVKERLKLTAGAHGDQPALIG